jgi:CRP/FNR family transcriptional regulator, anaerobic regulatory protein
MPTFLQYLQDKTEMTSENAALLTKDLRTGQISKGDFLSKQGNVCNQTFFVETGLLRAYTLDAQGKEHIIQFAPEGWLISDRSSAYFNEASDFFIEAIEDSTVVFLDPEFNDRASAISANYRHFNNLALQNHIRHLQKRINLLLGATAEERYLDFIRTYPDLTLRVPQWMIASYLGITPEGLSRVRKELARKNFKPGAS